MLDQPTLDSLGLKWRSCRFGLSTLFMVILFLSIAMSGLSMLFRQAEKEKIAAKSLAELGATLDTWVGWQEVVLGAGYAPVVQVDLRDVQDIHAAMEHLEALRHIEDLNLSGTSVVDNDIEHLKSLANLTSLDLSNTQITDAGLDRLQNLKNLHWLTISKDRITNAAIGRLRQQLPDVEMKIENE